MRVLYIITGLKIGGAEMMLLKLLEQLDRERFTPMVISLTTASGIGPRIEAMGIPVRALGMKSGLPNPFCLLRLLTQIRRLKPHIVHTWLYHADLIGGLAAKLAGVNAICWGIRSSNLEPGKTRWATRAVRGACAALSHVIPNRIFLNSETARRIHVELGYAERKLLVVPNGFDLVRFHPDKGARPWLRSELGCSNEASLVGLIGRFDPLKNHAGFLLAMVILHQKMPRVDLVLAGEGVDGSNEALMRAIEGAGLAENTHLLGLRDDIPAVIAALDVLVCSSHGEAFPNVIGEAMAAGVPCVATDVGDCAYIIGDTGSVVPAGDMEGIASSVTALLEHSLTDRAALGLRARERVAKHFEIGRIVQRYEDTYESLRVDLR